MHRLSKLCCKQIPIRAQRVKLIVWDVNKGNELEMKTMNLKATKSVTSDLL